MAAPPAQLPERQKVFEAVRDASRQGALEFCRVEYTLLLGLGSLYSAGLPLPSSRHGRGRSGAIVQNPARQRRFDDQWIGKRRPRTVKMVMIKIMHRPGNSSTVRHPCRDDVLYIKV